MPPVRVTVTVTGELPTLAETSDVEANAKVTGASGSTMLIVLLAGLPVVPGGETVMDTVQVPVTPVACTSIG